MVDLGQVEDLKKHIAAVKDDPRMLLNERLLGSLDSTAAGM